MMGHDAALSVYLPQTCDGDLLELPDFAQRIYERMMEAIERCDAVVAMLDGVSTDAGTCIELGYARALGKKIVGVRTDFRGVGAEGLCPMTAGVCDHLVCQSSASATLDGLAVEIVAALNK
jgi:nucleoside 2-deoxyribosyltransferase